MGFKMKDNDGLVQTFGTSVKENGELIPQHEIVGPVEATLVDLPLVDGDTVAAVAEVQATGQLTFSVNPANNATLMALNGFSGIVFKTVAGAFPEVPIGASLDDTLNSLRDRLNASESVQLSVATYDHTNGQNTLTIAYDAYGTIGNDYTIGANVTGVTRSGATLTGGVDAVANEQKRLPVVLHTPGPGGSVEVGSADHPLVVGGVSICIVAPGFDGVGAVNDGHAGGLQSLPLVRNANGTGLLKTMTVAARDTKFECEVVFFKEELSIDSEFGFNSNPILDITDVHLLLGMVQVRESNYSTTDIGGEYIATVNPDLVLKGNADGLVHFVVIARDSTEPNFEPKEELQLIFGVLAD